MISVPNFRAAIGFPKVLADLFPTLDDTIFVRSESEKNYVYMLRKFGVTFRQRKL